MTLFKLPRFSPIRRVFLVFLSLLILPVTFTKTFAATRLDNLIPIPVSVHSTGSLFTLAAGANIYVEPNITEIAGIGEFLADKLNPSTGYAMQVLEATGTPANGNIYLTTLNGDPALGQEGYNLSITENLVTLSAYTPTGLFRGIQTIRQILPASIEQSSVQPGPWQMATGTINDSPRYAWRGYMLDVARHFFSVDEIKRQLDLMASYKMNVLHLHLSDDQGWRLEIKAWPNLTLVGGSTEVGGGAGGFYTQADYTDIVNYAQSRYITIIPEIDMPGHINAALASYPELNCDGVARPLNTTTISGASSLCVSKDITYTFVDDVVKELAALTPGPYIDIGGDESSSTLGADYLTFINRVQPIINRYHKQVMGWQDISHATLSANTAIQHWNWDDRATTLYGVQQGASVVMSPISLGQRYPGYVTVRTGYIWDPLYMIKDMPKASVLGVEMPLWTEIIATRSDLDSMTYPWLLSYAEIGWSPSLGRNWLEYKVRLGTQGPRLTAQGVSFYRSPDIPWRNQ